MLLYEIDQSQTLMGTKIEAYLRLYDDHVEIRKPQSDGAAVSNVNYLMFNVPIHQIERVEYKPAGGFLANGILQFFVKGEPEKRAAMTNIAYAPNAINFKKKYNDVAAQIKQYMDSHIN